MHVDGPKVVVETAAKRGKMVCGYHASQAKLAPNSTTTVKVGGLANVPADASAVFVMLTATGLFAGTWVAQRQGYLDGEVTTLGLILGVAALGLLVIGGTLGGALAYVYGVRVVKQDVPIADALIPGRLDATDTGRTDWTERR